MENPTETVGEWKQRKGTQGARFNGLYVDRHGDYGTKFVLIDNEKGLAVIYGQLSRPPNADANFDGQPAIDLDDDEIRKAFGMPDVPNPA